MAEAARLGWSGKSRGGRFGYLFFAFVVRVLGLRCAYAFLAVIAVYFIPFAPKATSAIWSYNRRRRGCGRLRSAVELYRHYYVFGQTLIDRMAFRCGAGGRFGFEFDNYDRFIDLISHSGAVMIGAHVGCWEAGTGFFGHYGRKINIVMFDAEHRRIKEVLAQGGRAADYKIIAVNEDPLTAMLQIKLALDEGEYVCFNGDRYLDAATAVPAEFLGGRVRLPGGPFRIASKCRKPVIFYYAVRERGRKYRFLFTDVPAEETRDERRLIDRYVASLEEVVRRYPRQWFNFYRFWDE